jgi:hypothetical protein
VEELTLPQLEELMGYWKDHPPLHLMVESLLGIEGKGEAVDEARQPTEQDLAGLVQAFRP